MSTSKWSILPVALLMAGTLALAQSQTQAAQGSGSSASATAAQSGQTSVSGASNLEAKEAGIFGEVGPDGAASVDTALFDATSGINRAIDQMSRAFDSRDLDAFKQLWPSISGKRYKALGKSFGYFKNVSRNFTPAKIDVNGDTATVEGTYSGYFMNGAIVIPSGGQFHATMSRAGSRWIVTALVCK